MTEVRRMAEGDFLSAIELGEGVHKRSRYSHLFYDKKYLLEFARRASNDPDFCFLVSEQAYPGHGPLMTGFFVGCVQPLYFSGQNQAVDLILFAVDDRRGMLAAKFLVAAFERWALDKGAVIVDLGITTGIHEDRTAKFYHSLGYQQAGILFRKEAKDVLGRIQESCRAASAGVTAC